MTDYIALLAAQETDCPEPMRLLAQDIGMTPEQHATCSVCNGTDRVPLIPGLRAPCTCIRVASVATMLEFRPVHRENCPGYSLVSEGEAEMVLREWLPPNGYNYAITQWGGRCRSAVVGRKSDNREWSGSTLTDALVQALGLEEKP